MVLWSYLLGCAGPALTAACAMTYKDPFVLPMNAAQRKEAKSAKISLAQVGTMAVTAAVLQHRTQHRCLLELLMRNGRVRLPWE